VLLFAGGSQLIQGLERSVYDWGVRASSRSPSDKVSIIAIDKQSIDNIGRWPWSREVHAKMVEGLANARAKVIGYTVFFSEPQIDPGLAYVNKLLDAYQRLVPDPSAPPRGVSPELIQIGATLREAESALNTDRKLAESFAKAGNVVLPMLFTFGEPRGKPDKPLPNSYARTRSRSRGATASCRCSPARSRSRSWRAWARLRPRWGI
jgi:serine/threonine-protein kinase